MKTQTEPIHIISLGAGVQSSTMALMAAKGEITPMPKCAIFADTQDEPQSVYDYLQWLASVLPFPIHVVTNGKLSATFGEKFVHIPAFKIKPNGDISMGKKQCTRHFKIKPIYRLVRDKFGATHKEPVIMWVGISLDEVTRMKPARVKYVRNIWPLIDARKSRHDCEVWLEKNGFPKPPKSACEFCPLHSDLVWRNLPKQSFQRAVKVDNFLRTNRGEFLHPSCVPLSEIDFSTEEQRGQINMFENECEGMCGV
jgi:hypothetical protein